LESQINSQVKHQDWLDEIIQRKTKSKTSTQNEKLGVFLPIHCKAVDP
jgi:hypothetical protein